MIERILFQNFKSFIQLELEELRPLTLISGRNNVGKSSVLDGIFLFFDHSAPESFVKLNGFRGMPTLTEPKHLWEPIFRNFDTSQMVKIVLDREGGTGKLFYSRDDNFVVTDNGEVPRDVIDRFISSTSFSYTLKFSYDYNGYQEDGHFLSDPSGLLRNIKTSAAGNRIQTLPYTQFINPFIIHTHNDFITWVGDLELQGKKELLVEQLRLIEPSITDLTTIMTNSGAQLYIKIDGRLVPLKLAGDGLNKWLFILLSMMHHPDSLLLIDEIETGIHYSAYRELWRTMADVAKQCNCQIIATTHSYECIVGAMDGLEQGGLSKEFCYFRLDREEDQTVAKRYSNTLLRAAIDRKLEVR